MKKDQTFIRSLKGWISGNAGLQEERELQQLAQEDPFLADALDGYQSTAGEDHEDKLQKLRKRLAAKEEKKRGLPIFLRIAAGGAILIAALFALRLVNVGAADQIGQAEPATERVEENAPTSVEQDEVVAQQEAATLTEEEEEQAEAIPSNPAPAVAAKEIAKPQPQVQPRKKTSRPAQGAMAKEKKPTAAAENPQEPIAAADLEEKSITYENASMTPEPVAEESMELEEEVAPARSAGAVARKQEQTSRLDEQLTLDEAPIVDSFSPPASPKPSSGQNTAREISGMVTDPEGEPLEGVSVMVPNTNIGTLTGLDGKYNLSLDRNSSELQFSYVGFQQTKVPLPKIDTYDIRLAPDLAQLSASEITVSGYKNRKSKKRSTADIQPQSTAKALAIKELKATGVSPAGGMNRLNRTIRSKGKRIKAHPSQLGQAVSLTFNIVPGNRIENLRIVESKGLTLDQEAIRLINLTVWELEPTYRTSGATVYCKVQF